MADLPIAGKSLPGTGRLGRPADCGKKPSRNGKALADLPMQYFLLLLQKKTLAKEKEPEGISNFPSDSLEATKKTASVFLELSRANTAETATRQSDGFVKCFT